MSHTFANVLKIYQKQTYTYFKKWREVEYTKQVTILNTVRV